MPHPSLPDNTHIGSIHLRVADLKRGLSFYCDLLGFQQIRTDAGTAYLSPSGELPAVILLSEDAHARPRPPRTTGLYHVAIRLPNRVELARVLTRFIDYRYPLHGAADHLVSEALYLSDPEGNGLELYCDRNPDDWPRQNGQIAMATDPLDFPDLLEQAKVNPDPWQHIHSDTDIGHVHLSVSDLHRSEGFYAGLLGFDITQRSYPGALFLSAGGYHHHVGMNIWESRNAPPPPAGSTGMISFEINIPDDSSRRETRAHLDSNGVVSEKITESSDSTTILFIDPDSIRVQI